MICLILLDPISQLAILYAIQPVRLYHNTDVDSQLHCYKLLMGCISQSNIGDIMVIVQKHQKSENKNKRMRARLYQWYVCLARLIPHFYLVIFLRYRDSRYFCSCCCSSIVFSTERGDITITYRRPSITFPFKEPYDAVSVWLLFI
jgi:hypothetical protein